MAEISKIKIPGSDNVYDIKDAVARQAISGAIVLRGTTTTPLVDMSDTNPIVIKGESYTAVANDAVFYGDAEFVFDGTNWHEFGDMSGVGEMGKVDTGTVTIKPKGTTSSSNVTFTGGTTDKVLGEATTFTNGTSSVTFGEHTKATVLTSSVTATVPKTSSTTKYLTASASGTTVGVATSGSAITDLGDASTDTFVKSYPGATSKLATTTVIGVGSTTTTASKATAGTAVAVAKAGTAATVANGSLGTETSTRTANTPMWGATVEDETLSFTFKPMSTTSVTPAVSNGSITPYTFADVTVPVKNNSATTVATGSLSASGTGGSVMTGLGTAVTASAVTGYSDPSTATFAKTVSVTNQPTVSLTSAGSTSTGAVKYVDAVSTSGTDAVTFDTSTAGKTASAITALGAATAAAQTITVGTNDKVTAVTGIGTATAAGQTLNGTQESYTVYPTE